MGERNYIGRCIYCGNTKGLSDEHIIPYALNGHFVLLKASCKKCAKITCAFENDVLHITLEQPRIALGMRTRHKKKRKTEFPIKIVYGEKEEEIKLSYDKNLNPLVLPIFAEPGVLIGRASSGNMSIISHWINKVGGRDLKEITNDYAASSVKTTTYIQPVSIARMIAKIAYGFCILKFGFNALKEVYVLPSILGQKNDISMWVGNIKQPNNVGEHDYEIKVFEKEKKIYSKVRLFSRFDGPEYFVVVGKLI